MKSDLNGFNESIKNVANLIHECSEKNEFIEVISHFDADGLAAASIIAKMLFRIHAFFRIRIEKRLDNFVIDQIKSEKPSNVIFTDLGGGSLNLIDQKLLNCNKIILDHHQPIEYNGEVYHINPHLHGFEGSREISASGIAYFTAKMVDEINFDQSPIAIVGALGDSQDKNERRELIGLNKIILDEAVEKKILGVEEDLIFFGRETRSISKAIAYTTNPFIPGLSGKEDECLSFLINLGVTLKENERWRSISDLNISEKQKIFSEIAKLMSSKKLPSSNLLSLLGKVYTLLNEEKNTPFRDAREYASFLNACGRMEKGGLGVSLAIGDRGKCLEEAQEVLNEYRKKISEYMDWIEKNPESIEQLDNIYVVNGIGKIDENIIGTIASILAMSGIFNKPIIAIASDDRGMIKISGRTIGAYMENVFNLGIAFQKVSEKLNGAGGGHDAAAGAQVPKGSEREFIKLVDELIHAKNN